MGYRKERRVDFGSVGFDKICGYGPPSLFRSLRPDLRLHLGEFHRIANIYDWVICLCLLHKSKTQIYTSSYRKKTTNATRLIVISIGIYCTRFSRIFCSRNFFRLFTTRIMRILSSVIRNTPIFTTLAYP